MLIGRLSSNLDGLHGTLCRDQGNPQVEASQLCHYARRRIFLEEMHDVSLRSLSPQDLGRVQPRSPYGRFKIYIQGAGVEGVNGYYHATWSGDEFEKYGVFNGKHCTYELTTYKIDDDGDNWEIQVHPEPYFGRCESTVGRLFVKEAEPRSPRYRPACMSAPAPPEESYLLLYEVSIPYVSRQRRKTHWDIPFARWKSAGESANKTPYVAILPLDRASNAEM